ASAPIQHTDVVRALTRTFRCRALRDLAQDGGSILLTGILVGDHREIGLARRDAPHLWAFCVVALTSRAEDHTQSAGGDRAQHVEHLGEAICSMGLVYD